MIGTLSNGGLGLLVDMDLTAARSHGYRTAFVARPTEYGPRQKKDFGPEDAWDFAVKTLEELAEKLGA